MLNRPKQRAEHQLTVEIVLESAAERCQAYSLLHYNVKEESSLEDGKDGTPTVPQFVESFPFENCALGWERTGNGVLRK